MRPIVLSCTDPTNRSACFLYELKHFYPPSLLTLLLRALSRPGIILAIITPSAPTALFPFPLGSVRCVHIFWSRLGGWYLRASERGCDGWVLTYAVFWSRVLIVNGVFERTRKCHLDYDGWLLVFTLEAAVTDWDIRSRADC